MTNPPTEELAIAPPPDPGTQPGNKNHAPPRRRALRNVVDPRQAILLLIELGLSDQDIAAAVGAADRSVRRWRAGVGEGPVRYWKQIDDLRASVALLQDEGTLPDQNIVLWLRARNRLLGDRRPVDALAEGQFDQVREAALALVQD